MSIPIKWDYDVMKYINVEIEIEEIIILHEYFKVYLKIKNLLNTKISLDLEIGDCSTNNNEVSLINIYDKRFEHNRYINIFLFKKRKLSKLFLAT